MKHAKKVLAAFLGCAVLLSLTSCGEAPESAAAENSETVVETETTAENHSTAYLTKDDIVINNTYENTADGEDASYSNIAVQKTGDFSGDEADFYGENAAVFATNGATLDLSGILVETDGTHANGVFSYGTGTTVNISDSVILTDENCSGGLMTTGGGTMNASNLTIHTTGNSSAAIRSDRGGGTVNITGGSYTTDGKGSPVIYSTADITVSDAELTSTSSQGIVVEGKNSVTLNNVALTADNNSKNSGELLMTGSHELPVSQAKIVSIIGKNQNNRYRIRPPQDSELSVPERLCRTSLLHPVWTVLPSHPSMDGDIRNACSDTHAPSEDALSAYRIQDISEWRESSDRPHGRLSSS